LSRNESDISFDKWDNYRILNHDRLNPSVSKEIVPFRYEKGGLFMHFVYHRALIEAELTEDKVDWREVYYILPENDNRDAIETMTRGLLLRDQKAVESNIDDVLSTRRNFSFHYESYVNPIPIGEIVSFDNQKGRFKLLVGSRRAIEFVLACGKVPERLVPHMVPDYLRRFAY
jgi:hypothetical protein